MSDFNVKFFVILCLQSGCLTNFVELQYAIPEPTIEILSPRGLRVFIRDAAGIQFFAFHGNINKSIRPNDIGEISGDVFRKNSGRWVFEDLNIHFRNKDVLHYWLYIQANGQAHQTQELTWTIGPSSIHGNESSTRPMTNRLILNENFNSLNTSLWRREVKIPTIPDYEFCVFHNDFHEQNVEVRDGILRIIPTILEDTYGENATTFGSFPLSDCTSSIPEECSRQAASFNILPPIISVRLTTKENFSFKYGKVEIRARFPQGDWLYPEMWLVPRYSTYGADYLSGRILLGLSRGNDYLVNATDASDILDNRKLEFGIRSGPTLHVQEETISRMCDEHSRWAEDFHTYGTIWSSKGFTFLVDNEEVGRLSPGPKGWLHNSTMSATSHISPFDQEFYVSIGLGVGGIRVFPDNTVSSGYPKPWKNSGAKAMLNFWHSKGHWYPSWRKQNGKKSALEIDYIRIWSI